MAKVTIIEPNIDTSLVRSFRCAVYCRVSSSSEEQLHSYAAQVKYYSEKFKDSDTEELVDIYADEGITGTSEDKRDDFKRLIMDCKRGKIDRIYTKSISRFARNTKDCLKNIRELKALGISVFFEKENIDTAKVTDEMMITLMGGMAQEESTSISQNMRWSVQKRMKNGTYGVTKVPYGYRNENGKLVIDKEKADIVKMIFSWYLSGTGIATIVMKLNSLHIPTSQNGHRWYNWVVAYILTNERYIGNMLLQKTWASDTMPVRRYFNKGEKEQYLIEASHEAIISNEDYYRVQELLAEKEMKYYRPKGEKSVFSSKIKCGECGSSYKRKKNRGKFYWVCKNHDIKAENCQSKPIQEVSIKQAFIRLLNKLILHHREILLPLQKSLQEIGSKRLIGNTRIIDIRKEIAEVKEQKHIISRLRTKGFLDEKKYNEQLSALESKRLRLERELNSIKKNDNEDTAFEELDALIDCFENTTAIQTEFDDELFSMIVDKIIVKGSTLEFNIISGLKFSEKI